jgi:rhodanese-related sulfurtransferase
VTALSLFPSHKDKTIMSQVQTITPERAAELVKQGAVLIDIREAHEHAIKNIPGAQLHALSQIDANHPLRDGDTVRIYQCKAGGRTNLNATKLAATSGNCQIYLLGGGIDAWRRAGLPTTASGDKPATGGGLLQRQFG